jgi:uncharacterized membrane protein
MFRRTETDEQLSQYEPPRVREEVEATLRKLQILKSRISELRDQCEELRKLSLHVHTPSPEIIDTTLRCTECGRAIEPGEEIVIKDSDGREARRYHKECFKLFWV